MTRNLVIPPSTRSSNTMSASSRPLCGRAWGLFSILTATAGREVSRLCGSSPVRGQTSGSGTVGSSCSSSATSFAGSGWSSLQAPSTSTAASAPAINPYRLPLIVEGSFHLTGLTRNQLHPDGAGSEDHRIAVLGHEARGLVRRTALPLAHYGPSVTEQQGFPRAGLVLDLRRGGPGDVDDFREADLVDLDQHIGWGDLGPGFGHERFAVL